METITYRVVKIIMLQLLCLQFGISGETESNSICFELLLRNRSLRKQPEKEAHMQLTRCPLYGWRLVEVPAQNSQES